MAEISRLIESAAAGDRKAAGQLLPLVYDELRRLAAARMNAESPGQTLQPTALVHEAYLKLLGNSSFDGRGHFFAAAAEAMRRILVDNARRKQAVRHGGDRQRHDADLLPIAAPESDEQLVALDDALEHLARLDPVKAEVVKLRYFAGMTISETADALGISAATANRYWVYSRAWLYQCISGEQTGENPDSV